MSPIRTPPDPGYWNINTIIQTPDGEVVPAILSRYGCLLEVYDGWLNSGVPLNICVGLEAFHKWRVYLS